MGEDWAIMLGGHGTKLVDSLLEAVEYGDLPRISIVIDSGADIDEYPARYEWVRVQSVLKCLCRSRIGLH